MPDSAKLPHEPSHVSIPALAAGLGVIAGGVVISLIGGWLLLAAAGTPSNAPNNAVRPAIQGPVQETDAPDALARYRGEQAAKLKHIDAAMQQMAGERK